MTKMIEPPRWVRKRDGRVVPFDADRINHSVFLAAEEIKLPDVLLARELTIGITHFLSEEAENATVSTEQITEVAVKTVRELGHPQLAYALENAQHKELPFGNGSAANGSEVSPSASSIADRQREHLRSCALETVYSRDLSCAHRDGFLTLGGLDYPDQLAGGLIDQRPEPGKLLSVLAEASQFLGAVLVLPSVEHTVRALWPSSSSVSRSVVSSQVHSFLDELRAFLEISQREMVLNVNSCHSPSWAEEGELGPLFASEKSSSPFRSSEWVGEVLLEAMAQRREEPLTLEWHLSESDFSGEERARTIQAARFALNGGNIRFVFDRPRREPWLAEGIQPRNPGALQVVGLHLPKLVALILEEAGLVDRSELLEPLHRKLRSLALMAISAGSQKRNYLRSRLSSESPLSRNFQLQRARLVVVPLGLEEAAQQWTSHELCAHPSSLSFAIEMLQAILKTLKEEGDRASLACCVDSPLGHLLDSKGAIAASVSRGPTCWTASGPVTAQIETIRKLQSAVGGGTGAIVLNEESTSADQLVEWLKKAWQSGRICRAQFHRPSLQPQQMTFPEE